jgi:hypothetical protein
MYNVYNMNIPIGEDGLPLVDPTGARIDLPQEERRRHHREAYNRGVAERRALRREQGVLEPADVALEVNENVGMVRLPRQRDIKSRPRRALGGKRRKTNKKVNKKSNKKQKTSKHSKKHKKHTRKNKRHTRK